MRGKSGNILTPEPDQNQPLTMAGCRSGLSHPSKLHFLPEVQKYLTAPWESECQSSQLSMFWWTNLDHPSLEELVLIPRLNGDQVHAVSPADVPSRQPVHLEVLSSLVLPGEEVVVLSELGLFDPVSAVLSVGEGEGS